MGDQPEPKSSEDSKPSAQKQVEQQVDRAKQYLMRFEMPQRLMLVGSALAFLLGFLSWYSINIPFGAQSINGFAPWHGKVFFLTSLGTVLLLTVTAIRDPLIGKQPEQNQKLIFLGLVGATLIFGPVWFMLSSGGNYSSPGEAGMSAGKTIWLWLALLAAGVAVAGGAMGLQQKSDDRA